VPHEDEATPDITTPINSGTDENHDDSTPDWLKNNESPFGSDDVLSKEVTESRDTTHTPEWMHDHAEKVVQSSVISSGLDENHDDSTPDWLKGADTHADTTSSENIDRVNDSTPSDTFSGTTTENLSNETHEIPDWLKGTEESPQTDIAGEIDEDISKTESKPVTENNIADTSAEEPEIKETVEHDIPDWLKGADTPVEDEIKDESESKTGETTPQ
jgi:hypothetical protein